MHVKLTKSEITSIQNVDEFVETNSMIEIKFTSNVSCSMMTKQYQNALKKMVQDLIDEMIDDAVGIADWKERRGKVHPTTPINQYGTGDFSSDLGSPLSTFSSTPNTIPDSATSPVTPSFKELAGTQIMDNESEPGKLNSETTSKDDKLVNYLIGEISDSKEEN